MKIEKRESGRVLFFCGKDPKRKYWSGWLLIEFRIFELMNQLISNNLSGLHEACKKFSVSNLYLFGSATTAGFNSESDIDFAVQFSEEISPIERGEAYFKLFHFLEDLFKRRVDLVSYNVIKNPIFKQELDKTKVELYAEQ